MAAGSAGGSAGRGDAVAGVAVGGSGKSCRTPRRRLLLEVATDVGTGGIGQIGDRGLVEEDTLIVLGPQSGGRIPLEAVGHLDNAVLVTEIGRRYRRMADTAIAGNRSR